MIRRKFNIYQILSALFFIFSLVLYFIFLPISNNGLLCNVQVVSIIGLVFYIFILMSWKANYYRILSPYFIFVTTLYLCLCGQSIMWAFGLNAGYRDLQIWTKLFESVDICKGLLFSYCCLLFLHCVVMFQVKNKKTIVHNVKNKNNEVSLKNEEIIYKVMLFFGFITCLVFIVPYLFSIINIYSTISKYGYAAQYDLTSYGISSLFTKIGDFFPVGVLTLFYALGKKNEYNKKNYTIKAFFVYLLISIYLICEILVEQRTGVILFSIAFLFIVFKNKKISKKQIILGCFILIIIMSFMRMIDLLRTSKTFEIADFLSLFIDYNNNPVIDFLGDIGWNLFTLVEFQKLIPTTKEYALGMSYMMSLTSIIPNLNFWAIHPATLYGEISGWLRTFLGYNFGIGCTPVAEAYYNFGALGFLVFYFWGKFLAFLNRKFEDISLLSNYIVVLFVGIVLKSCVRSSFVAVFRPLLLYVLLPILIVKILYTIFKNKEE